MFRLFECCALSFFERFVLSLFLKIERFVSDSAEIWICGLYFLANGNAAKGIIDLVNQAGAELVGMGFLIEKSFQHGGDFLRGQGIHVESLAIIESLDNCNIKIKE